MNIAILPELDHEMANTRRALKRVPDGRRRPGTAQPRTCRGT